MYQEGDVSGGFSISCMVTIKHYAVGRAETFCTIHISNLLFVSHIVYFCNDNEQLF